MKFKLGTQTDFCFGFVDFYVCFVDMNVLPTCMYVHHM